MKKGFFVKFMNNFDEPLILSFFIGTIVWMIFMMIPILGNIWDNEGIGSIIMLVILSLLVSISVILTIVRFVLKRIRFPKILEMIKQTTTMMMNQAVESLKNKEGVFSTTLKLSRLGELLPDGYRYQLIIEDDNIASLINDVIRLAGNYQFEKYAWTDSEHHKIREAEKLFWESFYKLLSYKDKKELMKVV